MNRFLNIEVLKHKWHIKREKKHRGRRKHACVRLSRCERDLSFTPRTQADPELERGAAAGVIGGQS